jgi:hypothetical protein
METDTLVQILSEQTILLRQILERLNKLENTNSASNMPVPKPEVKHSSALAHLNSLGISF